MKYYKLYIYSIIIIGLACPLMVHAQNKPMELPTLELSDPTFVYRSSKNYRVDSIRVIGNEYIQSNFIKLATGLTIPSNITYPGEALKNAIHNIYETGLFTDVKLSVQENFYGEATLVFEVVEQPRLSDYDILGIGKKDKRNIKNSISTLIRGYVVTPSTKDQAIQTILRFYENKGYWNTSVKVSTKEDSTLPNHNILLFDVNRGIRYEVKNIRFIGNQAFSDKQLAKTLKTIKKDSPWRIFSKALYTKEKMAEAKKNLINYYRNNGYLNASIIADSAYLYEYKPKKFGVFVDITVSEGIQYKVRNVTWEGNNVYSTETLNRILDVQKGSVFNKQKLENNLLFNAAGSDITSLYHNSGYLFFNITPQTEFIGKDSVDVILYAYEGDIAKISEVIFSGNSRTHESVARRVVKTYPGQPYNRDAIIRSLRELATSGFFDPENLQPDIIPNRTSNDVVVKYNLKESKSTDNFELSGGYSGFLGFIFTFKFNFNNFSTQRMFVPGGWNPIPTGDGQKLSFGIELGGNSYFSFNLGFSDPWFNNRPNSVGFNFAYARRNYINNRRETTGSFNIFQNSFSFGKRLKWPDDFFTQSYTLGFKRYDIDNVPTYPQGLTYLINIGTTIERNSIDNLIAPTSGSQFKFSIDVSPPVLGFNQSFKIKTSFYYHLALIGKLSLSNGYEGGYIGYFLKSSRSPFGRFFVGGTRLEVGNEYVHDNIELRAYDGGNRGISPYINGEKEGGTVYFKTLTEIRHPLVGGEQIQIVPYMFFEAGNSYLNIQQFNPTYLKRSVGLGMRLFLPILGLIDLSYGYRLDYVEGTDIQPGWKFSFNIGAPF